MHRLVFIAVLMACCGSVWAQDGDLGQQIARLESQLTQQGPSPELVAELSRTYAQFGDLNTAGLYADYLHENYPEFDALHRAVLIELDRSKKQAFKFHSDIYIDHSIGFDTNANFGTDIYQSDFNLADGQVLVLMVDPAARATSSAWVQAGVTWVRPLSATLQTFAGLRVQHYAAALLSDVVLLGAGVAGYGQQVRWYRYDAQALRQGWMYDGGAGPFFLSWQRDSAQSLMQAGLRGQADVGVGTLALRVGQYRDQPRGSQLRGGETWGYVAQLSAGQPWQAGYLHVNYQWRNGQDAQVYDDLFMPGIQDGFTDQRVGVDYCVPPADFESLCLSMGWRDQRHRIALNSWRGATIELRLQSQVQ